jgi:hypothetical protein
VTYTVTAFDPEAPSDRNDDISFSLTITAPCRTDTVDFANNSIIDGDDVFETTLALRYKAITTATYDFMVETGSGANCPMTCTAAVIGGSGGIVASVPADG